MPKKRTPVILSRGIWSNIDEWRDFGSELAATGRDVWLIELTGGPGQDCVGVTPDTCPDYTFLDLTDTYFPKLITDILARTGQSKYDYVGFSNGCRTALGSWGRGQSDHTKVDTFVGVGCPGAFVGFSPAKTMLRSSGETAVKRLRSKGLNHVDFRQTYTAGLLPIILSDGKATISVNLLNQYVNWARDDYDTEPYLPAPTFLMNNFNIIQGSTITGLGSDEVVAYRDSLAIFDNTNANVGKLIVTSGAHATLVGQALPGLTQTKSLITWRINNDSTKLPGPELFYVWKSKP